MIWPAPSERKTYDDVWRGFCDSVFSLGFMWELAKHDEVFRAYLKRKKCPELEPGE